MQNAKSLETIFAKAHDDSSILDHSESHRAGTVPHQMLRIAKEHAELTDELTKELTKELGAIDGIDTEYFDWARACEADKKECIPFHRQ